MDLGVLQIHSLQFRIFYAIARPRSPLGQRLRQLASGAHAVLIGPGELSVSEDVPFVPLPAPLPTRQALVRDVVNACGCSESVAAVDLAPDGARLVVDEVFHAIWFDGVEVTEIKPDTHMFRFVAELARAGPRGLDAVALTAILSPGRDDGTTAARQAKSKTCSAIRTALADAGRAPPADDPFPRAGRGSYRCGVVAYVRGAGPRLVAS